MTLARERAIATAYLISGDEDISEGVAAAQDMGVRVVLVGVPGTEANQAVTLIPESDEHLLLSETELREHFRPAIAGLAPAVDEELAAQIGHHFALVCANNLTLDQLAALLTDYPRIPADLDGQLLREAGTALGDLRDRLNLKVELRVAFWDGISEAVAGVDQGSSPLDA